MSTRELPDAETIVARHYPLYGPYDEDHTRSAASVLYELVRYFNYATGQGAATALPYASTAGDLVGNLHGAVALLDQTLDQLGHRARQFAHDPALYDATVRKAEYQHPRAVERANKVVSDLALARRSAAHLRTVLAGIHSDLNALGHREGDEN